MSKRILVADDARLVRIFIRRALSTMRGITILDAEDGLQARRILETEVIDVVLCDWDMPHLTGEELLHWIRAHEEPHLREMPFIMVTGNGEKERVLAAVQAGVDGYVTKPFSAQSLQKQVTEALNPRRRPRPQVTPDGEPAPDAEADKSPTLEVRADDGTPLPLEIGQLTARGLVGQMPVNPAGPAVLAPVRLHIGGANRAVVAGYVFRLEAAEDSPEARTLTVVIRFHGMDERTRSRLAEVAAATAAQQAG